LLLCKTAKELDSLAAHAARLYGITLLCASISWFLLHSTRDATVHITLIMSYVVVSFYL